MGKPPIRVAFIVSHAIQYYCPLYQRLAKRADIAIKVFFTWHSGATQVKDVAFGIPLKWDIPLTEGYDFEVVPNVSSDQGTQHFWGLNNPTLVDRVSAWQPDVVHVTGWAWRSHLLAMRAFHKRGIPVLFRGDSNLIRRTQHGPAWWAKHAVLSRVFAWPTLFLVVGKANWAYYEAFGVRPDRLLLCPHSIDVNRFAEPHEVLEEEARRWRQQLGIAPDRCVLLFAGKFSPNKRPIELMRAVRASTDRRLLLVMVGSGKLNAEVKAIANADPDRFRVLPFQNQSRMPVVYRLGDLFVLPSGGPGETWGLAVNEALACGRPVLISDEVGCAADVVDSSCGRVFSWAKPSSLAANLHDLTCDLPSLVKMRGPATKRAWCFDIERSDAILLSSLSRFPKRSDASSSK